MKINNIKSVAKRIKISNDDIFIIDVVRKVKDHNTWTWESPNHCYENEEGVLIKYYIIEDIDLMYKYFPEIMNLCDTCGARAYISVSPRNKSEVSNKIQSLIKSDYDFSDYYSFIYDDIINDESLITNNSFIVKLDKDDISYNTYDILNDIFKFHTLNEDCEIYRYPTLSGEQFVLFGPFDNTSRLLKEIKENVPTAKVNTTGGILLYMNVEDEK